MTDKRRRLKQNSSYQRRKTRPDKNVKTQSTMTVDSVVITKNNENKIEKKKMYGCHEWVVIWGQQQQQYEQQKQKFISRVIALMMDVLT